MDNVKGRKERKIRKWSWWYGSSHRAPAWQVQGPESNPSIAKQNKKSKKEEPWSIPRGHSSLTTLPMEIIVQPPEAVCSSLGKGKLK
jgi:hypothetical protein